MHMYFRGVLLWLQEVNIIRDNLVTWRRLENENGSHRQRHPCEAWHERRDRPYLPRRRPLKTRAETI